MRAQCQATAGEVWRGDAGSGSRRAKAVPMARARSLHTARGTFGVDRRARPQIFTGLALYALYALSSLDTEEPPLGGGNRRLPCETPSSPASRRDVLTAALGHTKYM